MHPKGISHPYGSQGCYTQWVKEANPGVVLKHKQCRDMTTSEPRTLNLEPLSLCVKQFLRKFEALDVSQVGKPEPHDSPDSSMLPALDQHQDQGKRKK
jgi:hypothetical protein